MSKQWIRPSVHAVRGTPTPEVGLTGRSPSQKKVHRWCAALHTSQPKKEEQQNQWSRKSKISQKCIYRWSHSFSPWLPLRQLQPQPVCGGVCVHSSGTGRYVSSWQANSPWGPRVRSGNFLSPCSAGTWEERTAHSKLEMTAAWREICFPPYLTSTKPSWISTGMWINVGVEATFEPGIHNTSMTSTHTFIPHPG